MSLLGARASRPLSAQKSGQDARAPGRPTRGSLALGFSALIVVISTLCAAVTLSSLRTYQASMQGTRRLQVQAAAEGAAVMMLSDPKAQRPIAEIGDCRIEFAAAAEDPATSGTVAVPLRVDLVAAGKTTLSKNYQVTMVTDAAGWQVWRMETMP